MPKKLIKKLLPKPETITNSKAINVFGDVLLDPALWHINRHSCANAVAVGLFCAFIPLPTQMIIAAFLAIVFRANILIAIPLVWITNPITIPPFFYFCYRVGIFVLGIETGDFNFELSVDWLVTELLDVWKPFLLGCFLVSSITALIGYTSVHFFWRYHIWQHIKERKLR